MEDRKASFLGKVVVLYHRITQGKLNKVARQNFSAAESFSVGWGERDPTQSRPLPRQDEK
jgi:hypothetical protein